MLSYGELGPFLSVFSILSLILYFVTRFENYYYCHHMKNVYVSLKFIRMC